jgi:hypothetical protein
MRALSIRQPFAELILRGIKTIEYRSRPTKIVGERFWIYAAGKWPAAGGQRSAKKVWSRDLSVPGGELPRWMIELARQVKLIEPGTVLPTGVIVGSAVIAKVTRGEDFYHWHLTEVERAARLRKPRGQPQPVWFQPFA